MKIEQVPHGSRLYESMKECRRKILREPLGLELTAKDIEGEELQIHIAAVENGGVIGTALLKPISAEIVKLRQMAVDGARQKGGVGKALVLFAENVARAKKFKTVEMHARVVAQGFYEKLGYETTGAIFTEVTLPTIKMRKSLMP